MAFKSAMLLVILLVAAVNAQVVNINVPPGTNSVYLGVWSPWYTISANDNTQTPFTLTFTNTNVDPNAPANSVEISSSSFTFNPTTRTQSFRVRSNNAQIANFEITSNMNADLGLVYTNNVQFSFENRTISIDAFGTTKVGIPSEPRLIYINVPSTSDLNFVPSFENNTISFSPNPIVIKAGALTGEFTWTSSIYGSNNWHVTFDVQGAESNLYFKQDIDGIYNFNVQQKDWDFSSPNPNILIGSTSGLNVNAFHVSALNNVTGAITVTPQAADVTFSPASVQLNSNNRHAIFNVTAVNANADETRTVTIFTSGDITQYPYTRDSTFLDEVELTVPKRTVAVKASSSALTINNITYISIAIPAPVNSGLTLTLSAANLVFNTSTDHKAFANQVSVSFSGATTSIVVAALAQFIGPDVVSFAVSGADAEFYNDVDDLSYSVIRANIITPSTYSALQNFWVGVESEPIPIRASISPIDWVSVRLFAPNVKFNPEVVRFRNGSEQQYFTITPLYTNNADVTNTYTTTIEYLLDGPNYDHYFDIPASTIEVQQREFQAVWSVHTNTDDASTSTLRLHKTYKVWASVNYIAKGEQVSLTPVSPFFSFSPKVLNFHGSTNRILFDAQVTGLPNSGANVVIDYIVGGKDGGLYVPLSSQTVSVGLRPLEIVGAVVSTDERVSEKKAILLTDRYYLTTSGTEQFYSFSPSVLGENHVYSFMIRSFALPDHDLTITPVSPHVKFSPSKITLKPSNAVKRIDYTAHTGRTNFITEGVTYVFNSTGVYAEANFTVEALAAGLHNVRFDLSGSDKDYYSRIPSQDMLFKLVMRPDSEPFKAVLSSSSSLFPSFVVVAVIAAFALVL